MEHKNPDPVETEKVGHTEKLNQLLCIDVLDWYHSTMQVRQQKKCERVGPVLRVGTLPRGNVTAAQETLDFVITAEDWIEKGVRSAPV